MSIWQRWKVKISRMDIEYAGSNIEDWSREKILNRNLQQQETIA